MEKPIETSAEKFVGSLRSSSELILLKKLSTKCSFGIRNESFLWVDPPVGEFVLGEDDQAGAVGGEADR